MRNISTISVKGKPVVLEPPL